MNYKLIISLLSIGLLLGSCTPSGNGGGSDTTNLFTIDFSYIPSDGKVKDPDDGKELPFYFDSEHAKYMKCLNAYYFTSDKVQLVSASGGFASINTAFNLGTQRKVKTMALGNAAGASVPKGCDLTWTFEKEIKYIKVYAEAYVKYDTYHENYSVDSNTYLSINDVRKDLAAHSASDEDETQELEYTINSNSLHIVVPREQDDVAQRLFIHKIDIKLA